MRVLVVVDMQNDFITGALGTKEAQSIVPNVVDAIIQYRVRELPIMFTRDTHYTEFYDNSLEGQKLPIIHCIHRLDGWEIAEKIKKEVALTNHSIAGYGEYQRYFDKTTFGSQELVEQIIDIENYLHSVGDELTIELCGVCTDICVISNALMLRAALPNVTIEVMEDCCAGTTPEKHEAALKVMESCQIDII
jgi:nicotinamidase-related amidase